MNFLISNEIYLIEIIVAVVEIIGAILLFALLSYIILRNKKLSGNDLNSESEGKNDREPEIRYVYVSAPPPEGTVVYQSAPAQSAPPPPPQQQPEPQPEPKPQPELPPEEPQPEPEPQPELPPEEPQPEPEPQPELPPEEPQPEPEPQPELPPEEPQPEPEPQPELPPEEPQPQPEPQPEPKTQQPNIAPSIAAAIDEDDEDEEEEEEDDNDKVQVVSDGAVMRYIIKRYSKSAEAKLTQCSDDSKGYYSEIKNYLLSFSGVKSRMSWRWETYRLGKKALAKVRICGKTIALCLALNPVDYIYSEYSIEDISDKSSYAETPCQFRIKNEKRLNQAKELIEKLMEGEGVAKDQSAKKVNYAKQYAYANRDELIERKLIKVTTHEKIVPVSG